MKKYSVFSCIRNRRVMPKRQVEMMKKEENEGFDGVCMNSNPMFHFKKHNKVSPIMKEKVKKKEKKKGHKVKKGKNRFKNLTIDLNSKKIPIRSRNIAVNLPLKNYGNTFENGVNVNNIYIGCKSSLPKHGWYQPCYECGIYTSKTVLFLESSGNKKNQKFHFHVCKECTPYIDDDVKHSWYKYIFNKYNIIFNSNKINW